MASIFDMIFSGGKKKASYGDDSMGRYLDFIQSQEESPIQALAQAIPAYGYSKNLSKYLRPAEDTLAAMGDINNPQYQQIYGQQKQQGQQNLAQQIAELSGQNRKLSAMGRTPLFSGERGGEELFRGITQGYQDIQNNAAGQTQNILANLFKNQSAMGMQRAQYGAQKASTKGGIFGSLAKVFGL